MRNGLFLITEETELSWHVICLLYLHNLIRKGANEVKETQKENKIGVFALSGVFMAYFCSITAVPSGGIVGAGTPFKTGLAGIFLGFVVGAIFIALSTWIGYKTGLKKDQIWKQMFGRQGFRICSFVIAFCMAFWACFDLFNAAQAMYNLMPEPLKNFGFCLAIVILLVVTILGGILGMNGVTLISNLSIPVAIALFAIIYVVSYKHAGGAAGLMEYRPASTTLTVGTIAQMEVGMWMAGYCGAIDLTVDAKNTRSVITASICGSGFVLLCFLVGQVGFIGTGMHTLADICASLGGGIFIIGSIFVMIAQGNTTPACNYMYSNSFSAVFNINRKFVAAIVPFFAAILAFVIMYGPGVDFISVIIDTISTLAAPLFSIMITDFYVIRRRNLVIKEDNELQAIRICPIICLGIGIVMSLVFKMFPAIPVPTFLVIAFTGFIYFIFNKLTSEKTMQSEIVTSN